MAPRRPRRHSGLARGPLLTPRCSCNHAARRGTRCSRGVAVRGSAQLMRTVRGGARTVASRVLRRTALLRQLRKYRQRAACQRGAREELCARAWWPSSARPGSRGGRAGGRAQIEALEARPCRPAPRASSVERSAPDRGALQVARSDALVKERLRRAGPGADARLRAVRGARRAAGEAASAGGGARPASKMRRSIARRSWKRRVEDRVIGSRSDRDSVRRSGGVEWNVVIPGRGGCGPRSPPSVSAHSSAAGPW